MKDKIFITDVTPRDGLQNLKKIIPVENKIELIERLSLAGCSELEVTSFVHPRKVPQFNDAELLLSHFKNKDSFYVLIPNLKGLQRALQTGIRNICLISSVSETFSKKNLGKGIPAHLKEMALVLEEGRRQGLKMRASLSMAFYCPDEKEISLEKLQEQVDFFKGNGCEELSLCDTCSGMNSERLKRSLGLFKNYKNLGLHLHTQGGKELAFVREALELGIRRFETGLKESGGCPFYEGSQSNLSTEDLVELSESLGLDTGIDLKLLKETQLFYRSLL